MSAAIQEAGRLLAGRTRGLPERQLSHFHGAGETAENPPFGPAKTRMCSDGMTEAQENGAGSLVCQRTVPLGPDYGFSPSSFPCLGNAADALSLPPRITNCASRGILANLPMEGYAILLWGRRWNLLRAAANGPSRMRLGSVLSILLQCGVILTMVVACSQTEQTPAQYCASREVVDTSTPSPSTETQFFAGPVSLSNTPVVGGDAAASETNSVAVENAEAGVEQVSEEDLLSVRGDYLEKAAWHDAGVGSISALVETYYWAMRDGSLGRFSECLSPREQRLFVQRRSQRLSDEFRGAVQNVLGYMIGPIVQTNGQMVLVIKHSMAGGGSVNEFLAVVKQEGRFSIDGEKGYLQYGHHGPDIPIALVLGFHHAR